MRRAAWLAIVLVACGGDDTTTSTGTTPFTACADLDDAAWDDALDGLWHLDFHYTFQNGIPISLYGVSSGVFGQGSVTLSGEEEGFGVQVDPFEFAISRYRQVEGEGYTSDVEECISSADSPADGDMLGVEHLAYTTFVESGTIVGTNYTGSVHFAKVERHDPQEADGFSLLGELAMPADGLAVNVRVRDGVAYVADYEAGIVVVDSADPAKLGILGQLRMADEGEIANDVKVLDAGGSRYVLGASSTRGLLVVNVDDPANPQLVAQWPEKGAHDGYDVHTIFVDEATKTAYLGQVSATDGADVATGGLDVLDLSDPLHPKSVGRWEASSVDGRFVHDLFVLEGRAYLASWEAGLVIVDVSDPADIQFLGQYADYDRRTSHSVWVEREGDRLVALHGDEDFGAMLRVLDVTDPAAIALLSTFDTRPEVSVHNVMLSGGVATVAWYQDGVRRLDLADLENPVQSGYFNTFDFAAATGESFFDGACGIDLVGDQVWVADITRGLMVLAPTAR